MEKTQKDLSEKTIKNLEPVAEQVKGGVKAPRDAASGLATGKRAHRP